MTHDMKNLDGETYAVEDPRLSECGRFEVPKNFWRPVFRGPESEWTCEPVDYPPPAHGMTDDFVERCGALEWYRCVETPCLSGGDVWAALDPDDEDEPGRGYVVFDEWLRPLKNCPPEVLDFLRQACLEPETLDHEETR